MKWQKRGLISLVILSLLFCALSVVFADIGPKDQLTVRLDNPPDEPYYLDLLWQPGEETYSSELSQEELASLDPELLAEFERAVPEGWAPATLGGVPLPMWGDLVGRQQGDQRRHIFGYVGLPETCRILLVTESGKVILTEPFTRRALQSSVTLDCASGDLYQPPAALALGVVFLVTLTGTLLLEGVLLLLFGFPLRTNWKAFVLTNLITQIGLALTVQLTLLTAGTINAHLIRIPAELVILVFETLVYRRFLTGQSVRRRTAYGICANLVSWVAGFFLLGPLYDFMVSLC